MSIQLPPSEQTTAWWAKDTDAVMAAFEVDANNGLSGQIVEIRQQEFGLNQLIRHDTRSIWSILIAQFKSLIVGLLVVAAVVAYLFEEYLEVWAVVAVIGLNTGIGFISEWLWF